MGEQNVEFPLERTRKRRDNMVDFQRSCRNVSVCQILGAQESSYRLLFLRNSGPDHGRKCKSPLNDLVLGGRRQRRLPDVQLHLSGIRQCDCFKNVRISTNTQVWVDKRNSKWSISCPCRHGRRTEERFWLHVDVRTRKRKRHECERGS